MNTVSSTPLARAISAMPGTKAAKVLMYMNVKMHVPDEVGIVFGQKVGVHLTSVRGASFSPKYTLVNGVYYMSVGENLPGNRIRNAAENLLAVILRGDNWKENMPAYGEASRERVRRNRESLKEMRFSRRNKYCGERYLW